MSHFLRFADLQPNCSTESIDRCLAAARAFRQGGSGTSMTGKAAALIFEKPSLRTKLSFSLAVSKLGGQAIYFAPQEVGLGTREPVADVAAVVARMADLAVVRTFAQETLDQFAANSSAPVVNALSDAEHPCQAMADLLTILDRKGPRNAEVAYIGDGNNVAVSLAWAAVKAGHRFTIAAPEGCGMPEADVAGIKGQYREAGAPEEAAEGADVVYTDAWISMGQEDEAQHKRELFKGYQVTAALMDRAKPDAILMHPLPAHEGEEVAPGMLRDPRSVCFEQAENRLWAQMAIIDGLARA